MLRNRQRSIPSQANQQQQRSVQKPQNQQAATSPTQTDFPASIRSNLFASSQKNAQRPVYTPAQVQHIKNFIQVNQIRPQNTAKNLNQRQDTAETLNKTDRNYNQAQRNQMQPQKEANSNANNYLTRLTNYRDTRSSMHGDNAHSNAAQIDRGSQLEPKIVDPLPKSAPLVVQTQSSVSGVKYNNIDELGNATGPKMSLEHSSGQPPQALSSVQRPPSPVLNNSLPLLASAVGKSVSSHVNEPGTDNLGNSPDFPISISSPDISVALPSSPKSSDQLGTKQTGDTSSATMWPLNLFNGFFSSPKPARSLNVSTIMEVEDTPRPKVIDAPNSETLASKRSTSEITAKEGSPTTKKILSGKLKSLAVSARSSNSPSSAQPATTTSVDSAAPTANSENSPNQDPLKTIKNAVDSRSTFDLRVPSGLIGRVDTSLPSDLQLTSDQRLASDSRVYANASLPLTESNPKFPVTGKIPKKSAMKPTKGVLISDDEDQILHDDDFLSDVDKFLQKSPISTPVKPVSTYISSKIAESPSTAFANSAKSTSGNSPNTAPLVIRKPVPHPINLLPIKTAATLPPFSASPQASSEPMKATKNTPAVLELSPLAAGSSAKSINETPILTFVAGPPQPAAENNTTIKTINPTPKKTKLRLVEASSSDDSLSDETPESKPIVEKATKFNMLKRPGSDLNASPKSQKLINQTDAKIEILSEVTTPLSSEPVISFETILSEQTEKNNLLRLASRTSSKSYQNLMKADKSKDIPKFYAKANSPTPPPVVVHSSQIDDSNLPFNAETTGIIKLPIKSAWCKKSQNSEFQTVDVTRDASIKFVYRKGVDISFRSNPIKNDDLNYIQVTRL